MITKNRFKEAANRLFEEDESILKLYQNDPVFHQIIDALVLTEGNATGIIRMFHAVCAERFEFYLKQERMR